MSTEAKRISAAKWYIKNKESACAKSRAYHAMHRKQDLETKRARHKQTGTTWHIQHREQITVKCKIQRLEAQELKAGSKKPTNCNVCERSGKICFDHDHVTGLFRGWLCLECNYVLGHVHDSQKILRKLAAYICRPIKSNVLVKCARRPKDRIRLFGEIPLQCEVCKSTQHICVDHCHKTKLFRGWLCHSCNVALGHVEDSSELLLKLAQYLRSTK